MPANSGAKNIDFAPTTTPIQSSGSKKGLFCSQMTYDAPLLHAVEHRQHLDEGAGGEDALQGDGEFLDEGSDDVAEFRMLLADDLRDLAGQEFRLEARLLVFLKTAHGLAQAGISGGGFVGHLLDAGSGETGGEIARFDEDDLDAVTAHLDLQSFAEAFDGKFAGRIEALERQAHHAANRAETEDLATPLLPHRGEHGLREAHLAHEIRVHLELHIVFRGKLDRAADAHAGIVDQHVNAAFSLQHRLHGRLHGSRVADVRPQVMYARKLFHIAPHRTVNRMPVSAELLRHRAPEARRNASNQNDHRNHNLEIPNKVNDYSLSLLT